MISAIVLAAGQGRRFGGCKQLLPIDGKPLLEHVLHTLETSAVDDVVVVLGAHADAIRQAIVFREQRVILNPSYADGMSSSIQTGLRALPPAAAAALIVLADQPFVRPATIDRLIDIYRGDTDRGDTDRRSAAIVIPTYQGTRGNPVLLDRSRFAEMMNVRGDTGFRPLFGRHAASIVTVEVDDRGVVTDIDTPDDLDRARR